MDLKEKNREILDSMSENSKRVLYDYLSSDNTKSFLTERLKERLISFEFPGIQLTFYYPEDVEHTLEILQNEFLQPAA